MGLLDFFTPEAGQRRRAWLDDQSRAAGGLLDYYLGPTGIPDKVKAAAGLLDFTDAGDMPAAADASRELWNNPSIGSAANYAAAGAALALPLYSARMGQGIADLADDAVRAYDPSRVNIFAGPKAKTADLDAMRRAEGLLDSGADRADVWRDTGWMRGPDGKMRFEIDDRGLSVGDSPVKPLERYGVFGKFDDAVSHPDLGAAYGMTDLEFDVGVGGMRGGSMKSPTWWRADIPERGVLAGDVQNYGRLRARGIDRQETMDTIAHELQHDVQRREGFATGSNVSDEAAEIAANRDREVMRAAEDALTPEESKDLARFRQLKSEYGDAGTVPGDVVIEVHDLKKRLSRFDGLLRELKDMRAKGRGGALEGGVVPREEAYDQYQRVAGEVEARNAATRRDFTPEQRRATPPWQTQDVPDEEQIIRGLLGQVGN